MKRKRILLAVPDYSSLRAPIHQALRKLGHDTVLFDYYKPRLLARIYGVLGNQNILSQIWVKQTITDMAQRAILKLADRYQPDIVLIIKGERITPSTLVKLRNTGAVVVNWYPDWLELREWILDHAPYYDLFAASSCGVYELLKKKKVPTLYLPFAAMSDDRLNDNRPFDISFVGQHTNRREHFLAALKGLDLHLWGYPKWQQSTLAKIAHPPVSSKKVLDIYRKSKIVVNVFPGEETDEQQPNQLNLRIFEAMGAGSLLITQDNPILKKYFNIDHEIVTFKTGNQLRKKVRYYLTHDDKRKQIARAGWKKVKEQHTYPKRLKQLLAAVDRLPKARPSPSKTVILATPFDSTFRKPLTTAFEQLGFRVWHFDYRNILGNMRTDPWLFGRLLLTNMQVADESRFRTLNAMLTAYCRRLRPDYLFVVKGEYINRKTVERIKRQNVTTLIWQVDPTFHPKIWSYVKNAGRAYDWYISCEPGEIIKRLHKEGFVNTAYMLGAADGSAMRYEQHTPKIYDIVLVGTHHPVREQYLAALKGLDVHIWGWGDWENSSVAQMFEGGAVTQKQMLEIYKRSKIVINVGRAIGSTIPTNLRSFEAAQVGAFILTDCVAHLPEVFVVGKEIDCFTSPENLRKKVLYYLAHPQKRKKIARALYNRVKKDHIYTVRLRQLFHDIG